jgi:hypothetical protein
MAVAEVAYNGDPYEYDEAAAPYRDAARTAEASVNDGATGTEAPIEDSARRAAREARGMRLGTNVVRTRRDDLPLALDRHGDGGVPVPGPRFATTLPPAPNVGSSAPAAVYRTSPNRSSWITAATTSFPSGRSARP